MLHEGSAFTVNWTLKTNYSQNSLHWNETTVVLKCAKMSDLVGHALQYY